MGGCHEMNSVLELRHMLSRTMWASHRGAASVPGASISSILGVGGGGMQGC